MLAINGGGPVSTASDWPRWPVCTPDTRTALTEVATSGRWSISGQWTGHSTRESEFARRFAEFNGVPYCIPTANGTSSLVIALEALDIGAGDEVIVPGLTWVAPASAVVNVNAIPIIVDIDPNTYCLDTHLVRQMITPRTRAIIAVHLYCSMADMDDLAAIAQQYSLKIIEDCAQSHGSVWSGRSAGSMGHIGVFSMHQGKVLTSGEGGAAITSDPRLWRRLEQLRSDGRRYTSGTPQLGQFQLEEVGEVQGSNYCLSEFQAALLLDGLDRLDAQNAHRARQARRLDSMLSSLGGLIPAKRPIQVDRQTYYHYLVRYVPEAFANCSVHEICRALEAELGFWLHPPYPPLTSHRLYCPKTKRRYHFDDAHWSALDSSRFITPHASAAYDECIVFHHSVLLSEDKNIDAIAEAFGKVKAGASELRTKCPGARA